MNVFSLDPSHMIWPIGSYDTSPCYHVGSRDSRRSIKVDPYPSYMPNQELVGALVAECSMAFPMTDSINELYILGHDSIDRANGLTYEDIVTRKADGSEWSDKIKCQCGCGNTKTHYGQVNRIILFAKRIPIHPAMLRYLVAHEYGHAAFNYIRRQKGYESGESELLQREYFQARGSEWNGAPYSGGKWHLSPSEIIANDFRVAVMKREVEFWPHPETPAPRFTNISDWWEEAGCKIREF